MQDAHGSLSSIRDYHAHVYYDPAATRPAAEALRAKIDSGFVVRLGRWHDMLVGPHSAAMYQVIFAADQLDTLVPSIMLNRDGLSVLVHPNTGAPRDDHLFYAMWLGQPLAIRAEALPVSEP